MNHRERVVRALRHQEVDRVPLDFGGTSSSTINATAYRNLADHLGLPSDAQTMRFISSTVIPCEKILRRFDIDTRALLLGSPQSRRDKFNPDGSMEDEWGVLWAKPEGGHWYVKRSPFQDDVEVGALDRYHWPDPHDPGRTAGLRERARSLHEDTDYAVTLSLPHGLVHQWQFLRGFEDSLIDLVANPGLVEAFLQKCLDVWRPMVIDALEATRGYIDVVWYGDDIAIQESPMMSPETYRRLIKPYHRAVFDTIRQHTDAFILFHSCGSVYLLIPDLVELGVQAINPVQVSAANMDTKRLKREFGETLAFWGGVDAHYVLPFGTPEDVRAEVRRRIDDLAPGGGYVLNSVHNIQVDVPPENICAMFDEALRYGQHTGAR